MAEYEEITLADLQDDDTAALLEEVANEDVIKSGRYLAKVRRIYLRQNADDADFDAGRQVASMNIQLYEQDGITEVGRTYVKVSHQARHTRTGRIDGKTRLFAKLAQALGLGGDATAADVYEAAQQQMFGVTVQETYVVSADDLYPDHSDRQPNERGDVWVSLDADDDEARKHYVSAGYEARVQVRNILPID